MEPSQGRHRPRRGDSAFLLLSLINSFRLVCVCTALSYGITVVCGCQAPCLYSDLSAGAIGRAASAKAGSLDRIPHRANDLSQTLERQRQRIVLVLLGIRSSASASPARAYRATLESRSSKILPLEVKHPKGGEEGSPRGGTHPQGRDPSPPPPLPGRGQGLRVSMYIYGYP
jgi:hypothetical protein